MARKKGNERIEPSFDGPSRKRADEGLSVSEEDRVMPAGRRKAPARTKASSGRRRRSRPRRGFLGFVTRAFYWSFVLAIWGGIAGACVVAYYGAKMPSATTWAIPDRPPNVRIVSVDDKLIGNRGLTGGESLSLGEMSPYIPKAIVAIEDRRFYSHFGIDPIGLARAMFTNLVERHVSEGGSTLTQQLAKNLFLTPERTVERKVQEVLLALWLEHKFTKDQILDMYLNRVYFGSGAYGVEAASRRYFGKSARDDTLAEAALLAGLVKAPSRLSPAHDPKAAWARAQVVLQAMYDQGMIDKTQLATAMKQPASRAPAYWTGSQNYVADQVMKELPGLIGQVNTDIVVHTTVDLDLQKVAQKSIHSLIAKYGAKRHVSQAALVSIDNTGAVRALIGGTDYASSQYDRASEAKRQPGSAFKPFVYTAAMEAGRTPDSIRNDAPVKIGKWTPANYGGEYFGRVTLAEALARSLNSVAAQLVMEVGPQTVVSVAHRLGIQSNLDANYSIALGTSVVTPLELTAAYVPFANGGFKPTVHFVQSITTTSGKVLYKFPDKPEPRVLKPEIVGEMNAMMKQTILHGTARRAGFGWPAAGKTGTSQDYRDAWFLGYTANLTTGVWFGNDDNSPMKGVTGGFLPAMAWHDFMAAAHKGVPVRDLPGDWHSAPNNTVPAVAVNEDEDQSPQNGNPSVPSLFNRSPPADGAIPAAHAPRPPADLTSHADGNDSGRDVTASTSGPVPPEDVGGGARQRYRHASILDIILGRSE